VGTQCELSATVLSPENPGNFRTRFGNILATKKIFLGEIQVS
jgi:hypothetical protein